MSMLVVLFLLSFALRMRSPLPSTPDPEAPAAGASRLGPA
jgi:hypothetical protein